MDLGPTELIDPCGCRAAGATGSSHYRKVGTRRAQAISKVCFAAAADLADGGRGEVRLAFGSVAPTVIRARHAERALEGRTLDAATLTAARTALASDLAPIDDMRSTAHYRREVAKRCVEEFLTAI